jgi:hypothetical protein
MICARSIAAVVLCSACAGPAQMATNGRTLPRVLWAPLQVDWGQELHASTVSKEMINGLKIAGYPIILEETKLGDAQKRFGGEIGSRGDAGTAEAWLCLRGNDRVGPWMFWLSSFEIDGPTVGGFQWRRLASNETADPRCQIIGKNNDIQLPLAIRLGTTERDLRRIMGKPSAVRGGTLIFCHDYKVVIDKQNYDASNSVGVELRDNAVWAIIVEKSTVN